MPVSASSRINRTADFASDGLLREFTSDVRAGLSKPQKELHSKYLYDELGSALFEAITHLPEYGLTRADERLLEAHGGEIARSIPRPASVIELGSGTGQKTRHILREMSGARYFPIDVSSDALARCEHELADVAEVYALQQLYLDGMAAQSPIGGLRRPFWFFFSAAQSAISSGPAPSSSCAIYGAASSLATRFW
jgi:uncharacterized SAM-dependent methyltransferase